MKLIVFIVALSASFSSFANWTDLNSAINDDLTGVVMNGSDGLVSGRSGIYYTLSGGVGPGSWQELSSFLNVSDSITYEKSRFSHCAHGTNINEVMFCGQDTVNNQAVIYMVTMPGMTAELIYTGSTGTSLNYVTYAATPGYFYAVGMNGLVVKFTSVSTPSVETIGLSNDLNSIAFYGNKFALGMNGWRAEGLSVSSVLSITNTASIGVHEIKDLLWQTNSGYYGVGSHLMEVNIVNGINNYGVSMFSLLDYNVIYRKGSYDFLGTNNGIFRRNTNSLKVEQQPSSIGYVIHEFHADNSNSTFYAVGDNGAILSTTNDGGTPSPFVAITGQGGCLNSFVSVQGDTGPSASCQWFVDGVPTSTSCAATQVDASVFGIREVMLVASKGGLSDTAILDVHIVEVPEINYLTDISDSILCKSEAISVFLDTTQQDVRYVLFNEGFTNAYNSGENGNGGTINFITDSISVSGNYIIQAQSVLANCTADFTDTISILVEHTKAAFHSTLWNVALGDSVVFLENSTDALNFQWTFGPSATPGVTGDPNPHVEFSTAGGTDVELIAWSDNGCYDTIVGIGPEVYTPIAYTDSCWINQKSGIDQQWIGSYYEDISDMDAVEDGFVVVGQYSSDTLESQNGLNYVLPGHGGYLAKYNFEGVVEWVVRLPQTTPTYQEQSVFTELDTDDDGNIYVISNTYGYDLVDNSGKITTINGTRTLMKFDSLGRFLWQNWFSGQVENVCADYQGNVYVSAYRGNSSSSFYHMGASGAFQNFSLGSSGVDHILFKIGPSGEYLEHVGYDVYGTSIEDLMREIDVDADNNVFVTGSYRSALRIYDSSNSQINSTSGYSNDESIYISKFDSALNHLWTSAVKRGGSNLYGEMSAYDLIVDTLTGNAYVSGRTQNATVPLEWWVYSTNGAIDTVFTTGYIVSSFNSAGVHRWTGGATASTFSRGLTMHLEDSLLYVAGVVQTPGCELFGTNQATIQYSGTQQNMFVCSYDTLGAINGLYKSGNSNLNVLSGDVMVRGLFYNDGCFYTNRSAGCPSQQAIPLYGDTVYFDGNGADIGWIHKFSKGCSEFIAPTISIQQAATVCYNGNYTLPDSSVLSNLTTDFVASTLIESTLGFDSLFFTSITVLPQIATTETESICKGVDYSFPDGTTYYNIDSDTTHTTVMSSFQGCDSTITYQLTLIDIDSNAVVSNEMLLALQSGADYAWIDCSSGLVVPGATNTISFVPNNSGDYAVEVTLQGCVDTTNCLHFERFSDAVCEGSDYTLANGTVLTNVLMDTTVVQEISMDTLIVEEITTMPIYTQTLQTTLCNGASFTFADGNLALNLQQDTIHTSQLISQQGCDSLVIEEIDVMLTYSDTIQIDLCAGSTYTFADGSAVTNLQQDTLHSSLLTSEFGCDSLVTEQITLQFITAGITSNNGVLESTISGDSFAWLDCDNNYQFPAVQGIGQTYTPAVNGNYAVEVTTNGCSDTSVCFLVDYVELSESKIPTLQIAPNPSENFVQITGAMLPNSKLTVLDMTGRVVFQSYTESESILIDVRYLAKGSYLIRVELENRATLQSVFVKE